MPANTGLVDDAGHAWPAQGWIVVVAAAAGAATAAGFAPVSLWPATLLGVAGLALTTVRARTVWHAMRAAGAFGTLLTSLTLNWMSLIDLGAALGLILLVTSWYALLGAGLYVAGRTRWWPLLGAGAWVLMEYAAAHVPFGGFGWLRLGYAMLDSPLSGLLPLVGVGGLSLATAITAHLLAWLVTRPSLRRGALMAIGAGAILASAALGGALPPAPASGSATLGWVQGGAPGGGVYGIGPPRSTTVRHATKTLDLAADITAGRVPQPDVVVWPENATDLDPGSDPDNQTPHQQVDHSRARTATGWHDPRRSRPGPATHSRTTVVSARRSGSHLHQEITRAVRGVDPLSRPAPAPDPPAALRRSPVRTRQSGRRSPGHATERPDRNARGPDLLRCRLRRSRVRPPTQQGPNHRGAKQQRDVPGLKSGGAAVRHHTGTGGRAPSRGARCHDQRHQRRHRPDRCTADPCRQRVRCGNGSAADPGRHHSCSRDRTSPCSNSSAPSRPPGCSSSSAGPTVDGEWRVSGHPPTGPESLDRMPNRCATRASRWTASSHRNNRATPGRTEGVSPGRIATTGGRGGQLESVLHATAISREVPAISIRRSRALPDATRAQVARDASHAWRQAGGGPHVPVNVVEAEQRRAQAVDDGANPRAIMPSLGGPPR